jgi:hypothetical protein
MVYVLNNLGQPLMPTENYAKVRILLKQNRAKVVKRCPFTIQLLYSSTNYTQEVILGVDAGSKTIGLSATTKVKELYASEVTLRNDIVGLLASRREYRRTRRSHKTRYRKARFNNRVSSKKKGWLAPSILNKIESHLKVIENIYKILPINRIIVEVASFNTQLLKAQDNNLPLPSGMDYQQGEQLGFWNVREFVLFRDKFQCQCCKGKSKDKILNVHHIESRKTGGNSPSNLITLCKTCHDKYHRGLLPKFQPKRQPSYRDGTFMGIMRWKFYNQLKELYPNVSLTYGYITKNTRITNNLPKTHYIDARCISGNPLAKPLGYYYKQKKVRCHNRQIHKLKILKGGIRKRNQAEYEVKGYHLFDKVSYQGHEYFIFGRRANGFFDIRDLDGNKVNKGSISSKKLKLLENHKHYLVQKFAT